MHRRREDDSRRVMAAEIGYHEQQKGMVVEMGNHE